MANVNTFNLSVYLPTQKTKDKIVKDHSITFRGISRVAVKRYQKYYITEYSNPTFLVEERK